MLDRQTILTLFEVTAQGLNFNLDFIPTDKMEWKPAPHAKSALEIVNHLSTFLDSVSGRLAAQGQPPAPATDSATHSATSREEAKAALARSAAHFAAAVRGASGETLLSQFRDDMPLTLGWMVTACVIDTVHHAGQIAYLQTLLGDEEIHFDGTLPDFAVA